MVDTGISGRQPLAEFLITKNQQLESELGSARLVERDHDKLEEEKRYLKCLLNNYVQLDKEAADIHKLLVADSKQQSEKLQGFIYMVSVWGAFSFLALIDVFLLKQQSGGLLKLFILFQTSMVVGVFIIIQRVRSDWMDTRRYIEDHEIECSRVKRSNHLFPEFFD